MSAEADYLKVERDNILKTIDMLEVLLEKEDLSQYEVIALGKLLQDIYTGIERVLRHQLERQNIKIKKTENWHKELLLAAKNHSLISDLQFEKFRDLLLFRHLQIHGYGFMLDQKRLLQLALDTPIILRDFLSRVL